jgi:hypothetical protein
MGTLIDKLFDIFLLKKNRSKAPTSIGAAIYEIVRKMKESKEPINKDETEFLADCHFGYGRWLRNNWGLWLPDSPLVNEFNKLRIWHADDMSSILLTSAHRLYSGKSVDLEKQAAHFHEYWGKQGVDPYTGKNLK